MSKPVAVLAVSVLAAVLLLGTAAAPAATPGQIAQVKRLVDAAVAHEKGALAQRATAARRLTSAIDALTRAAAAARSAKLPASIVSSITGARTKDTQARAIFQNAAATAAQLRVARTAVSAALALKQRALAGLNALRPSSPAPPAPPPAPPAAPFTLSSSAFAPGAPIPIRHSCDGANVSPPLTWANPPAGTVSFAILLDDLDAGSFTHWLTWGIPGSARSLAEGTNGPFTGRNLGGRTDAAQLTYFGPCPPPPDGAHRYVFHLYALSAELGIPTGSSRAAFTAALAGKVLGEATLTGTFDA